MVKKQLSGKQKTRDEYIYSQESDSFSSREDSCVILLPEPGDNLYVKNAIFNSHFRHLCLFCWKQVKLGSVLVHADK